MILNGKWWQFILNISLAMKKDGQRLSEIVTLLWYAKLLLCGEAAHRLLQLIRKHKSAKENQGV